MISMNIGFLSLTSLPTLHTKYISTQSSMSKKQSITVRAYSCKLSSESEGHPRRIANYQPPLWDHPHIQSLTTPFTYQRFGSRLEELKGQVKHCLISEKDNFGQLELIEALQRLGVAYHFEKEINQMLDQSYLSQNYEISSENEQAIQVHCSMETTHKMLRLEARDFIHVYEKYDNNGEAKSCTVENEQAIQQTTSLYYKLLRLETRDFIHVYEKYGNKNLVFLELAKLDFNLVQSIYQTDLIELSRWWRDLNLIESLPFSRDRLVENFIWAVGIIYEPQFSKCRIGIAKFISILSAIDDIYDIHGSLDELELFTQAVSRWDIQEMEKLPKYMKICYLAMFNFANGICYDIMKDQGINVLPYIRKEWESLCKSYLMEARWFNEKHTPKFDEYLEIAWISIGGPAAIMHFYILQGETITTDLLDCLMHRQDLGYWASLILRLSDDLGTSEAEMMRGDVAKSIQCYMNEMDVSMEEATKCIKNLRRISWKKLNEECIKSSLPKSLINMAVNMARTSQCIYESVDGISDGTTKDLATALFTEPIRIKAT